MSYLNIENFRAGLDDRKYKLNLPAGSLKSIVDGHINPGGEIEKRKAFVLNPQPTGTFGMQPTSDGITVFGSGLSPSEFTYLNIGPKAQVATNGTVTIAMGGSTSGTYVNLYSTDNINFQPIPDLSGIPRGWCGYANGLFVAVEAGGGRYNAISPSSDGISFPNNAWENYNNLGGRIASNGSIFMQCSGTNGVYISSNGTSSTNVYGNSYVCSAAWFLNNQFMVPSSINNAYPAYVSISATGASGTWSIHAVTGDNYNVINALAYGNGVFVAITSTGKQLISKDNGLTWSYNTFVTSSTVYLLDIAFGNNTFYAAGYYTTGSPSVNNSVLYASVDGLNWTQIIPTNYGELNSITYVGGGRFIVTYH